MDIFDIFLVSSRSERLSQDIKQVNDAKEDAP
jgi:hypothetical protein